MKAFGRKYKIQLFDGDEAIEINNDGDFSLNVKFQFELSERSAANKGWVEIYNLDSGAGAYGIEEDYIVDFSAGYENNFGRIMVGDIVKDGIKSKKSGSDSVVRIEFGDGARALESAVVERSYPRGASGKNIIEAIAKTLAKSVNFSSLPLIIVAALSAVGPPTVVSGRSSRELDRVLRQVGAAFTIQDDVIVLFEAGKEIQSEAIVLDETNSNDPEPIGGGRFEVFSILIYGLRPLRLVAFDFDNVSGLFVIEKVVVTGDYGGDSWNSKTTVRPI